MPLRRASLQNGRWPRTSTEHRGHAALVCGGELAGASLKALSAEALDVVEGSLLDLADAIAEALVWPVEDCALGRARGKARRLERLVAQASAALMSSWLYGGSTRWEMGLESRKRTCMASQGRGLVTFR